MLSEPRFENGRAMLIAGIRRKHKFEESAVSIPAQWREFRSLPHFRARTTPSAYGVICGAEAERFEYMTGVEVESFENLPAETGRMRIPAQRYAVFTHEGHVSELGQLWEKIWREWLPSSGYADAMTPPFELYDQRFDPETGTGQLEIWTPIR